MSESEEFVQERQQKQMFLKEMILDPGHDTAKFSEYICSIRADGGDIDVWALSDLQRIVEDFLVLQAARAQHQNHGEGYYGNADDQYADNYDHSYDQYSQHQEQPKPSKTEENKNIENNHDENPFDLRPSANVSEPQNQNENPFDLKPASNEPAENPFDLKPQNNQPVAHQQPISILPKSREEEQPGQGQSPQLQAEKSQSSGEGPLYVNRDENCEEFIKIEPVKKERVSPTEAYKGILRVNKQESTQLSSHPSPSITICDPTQVKGGIFSSSYVQYTVKTAPLGWTVKRRFNDFFWLRDTLVKLHPGVFIPPIPKKKNKNKFEEDVIRKRMYFFEIFLNACLEQADLKGDKYLFYFLHLPDESQFNNIKKKADSQAKVQRVENLYKASGETMLDTSPEFEKYSNLAEEYCTQTEPIYKKIRKFTKVLLNNMKQTSSVTMELAKCFKDLNVASNKFNKTVPERQSIKFEDTYTSLTKLMLAWSEQVQKQTLSIHKNLFSFYKYSSLENGVFKEMNQAKNKFQAECKKLNDDLVAKKDRMFETMDVADWELDEDKARSIPRTKLINDKTLAMDLMLVTETQQVKSQNDMLAYLNGANYSEISKGFNLRGQLYKKNFQEFVARQTEHMTKLHTKWAEIIERCIDGNGKMDISMVQSSLFSMGDNNSLLKSNAGK